MIFRLLLIIILALCFSAADTGNISIEPLIEPSGLTTSAAVVPIEAPPSSDTLAQPPVDTPNVTIPTDNTLTPTPSKLAESTEPTRSYFFLTKSATRTTVTAVTLDPANPKKEPTVPTLNKHASFWKDFRWEDWEDNKKSDSVRITPYMSGFGEIKAFSLRVAGNRGSAVKDSLYTELLRQIKEVDFQIESRFNLLLQARINEEAEVNYNIVQEPNMPQKTDVSLRIRKTQINFGDLTKTYSVGAFTNISKKVDGISVVGSEGPFSYNFGFGQAKSQNDTYSRQGSGGTDYPLRYKPVLENSVKVYVNDKLLAENVDYQINYFEGKIIFKTPKINQDALTFTYEYTNPLEDFIPIASHVNFLGISGEYNRSAIPEIVPLLQDVYETHSLDGSSRIIALAYTPILLGSETVSKNGRRLIQNRDYYIQYDTGRITLTNTFVGDVAISYQTNKTNARTEEFLGQGRQTVYYLRNLPILEGSETITIQGLSLNRGVDYRIDPQTGRLLFVYPIPSTALIHIDYLQSIMGEDAKRTNPLNTNYKLQFGYFKEFAKAQKDLNTKLLSETFSVPTSNVDMTIKLGSWPIVQDLAFGIVYNGAAISANNINPYTGEIGISANQLTATGSIVVSYYYYKEYGPSQWFFTGSDATFENNMIVDGLTAHRIQSNVDQPIKFDRYNTLIRIEYKKISSPIYLALIYGKDYTIKYANTGVGNGQVQIVLYNEYLGQDNVVYGVPSNLTAYDLFRVTYQYNKSNIPDPGDIVHDQFEAVYQQSFGSNLDLSLDVARTNQESARSFLTTSNTIATSGQYGTTYTLTYPNIVENSEIVYVNNQPNAIKNEHYYINYTSGKITFINMNPSTQDVVIVKYSYFSTASGENIQRYSKQGNAIKFKTRLQGDSGNTQLELYTIDPDYKPFGASSYAGGSNIINWSTGFSPYNNVQANTSYFINRHSLGVQDNQGKYLNQSDEKIVGDLKYNPGNTVQVGYHWEKETSASDPNNTTSKNLRAVDTLGYRNNLSFSGGPPNFYTTYTLSDFQYASDFLDRVNYAESKANAWTVENQLALLENRATLKSSYAESSGFETDPNTANHKLRENSFQRTQYQLSLKPLPFLDTSHFYVHEFTQATTSFDANNTAPTKNTSQIVLQNYQHNWSFYPPLSILVADNPSYQGSIGRSEKASLLLNQLPDNSNTQMNQLTFRALGLTSVTLQENYAQGIQSDGHLVNQSAAQNYTIGGITFLSGVAPLTIQPSSRRFSRTINNNDLPRNTTIYSQGSTYATDSHYGLSWSPFPFVRYDWDFAAAENFAYSTENRTTDVAFTTQTYPRSHIKNGLFCTIEDLIKSTYSQDYDLQENVKLTNYYATSNLNTISTSNINTNTTHLNSFALNNVLFSRTQPINLNIGRVYDDYIDTSRGLKYRDAQTLASDTSFSLWGGATVVPRFSYSQTVQYLRTSVDNIPLNQIGANFNSYLYNRAYQVNVDGTQPLSKEISLLLGYSYQRIIETTATPTTENNKLISLHGLGVGTGYKVTPIPDLTLSYTYTFKMNLNDVNSTSFQNYADSIVAQYTPAIVSTPKYTSNINVTFRRDHNWGIGLNDFAKAENNQANSTSLATDIQSINNITSTGVIRANVEIPMAERSNGNIEKFIFTAEGNIVEKQDATGSSAYSYTITSLVFSGKLIF